MFGTQTRRKGWKIRISALKEFFVTTWENILSAIPFWERPNPANSSPAQSNPEPTDVPDEQNAGGDEVETEDDTETQEPQTHPTTKKHKPRAPRRGPKRPVGGENVNRGPYQPKPELVCIAKLDGNWQIALRVPSEVSEGVSVRHGESILSRSDKGYFFLGRNLHESIHISWSSGKEPLTIHPFDSPALIFKMSQDWEGTGIKRNFIKQQGCYLVFADSQLKRKNENPPEALQSSFYEGVNIHYFLVERENETEDGFYGIDCFHPEFRFSLEGNKLLDGYSNMGTLFLGEPPLILDKNQWHGVDHVDILDEGSQWNKSVDDFNSSKGEFIRSALKDKRGGWFSVRIYSSKGLIDSYDFQFLRGLKGITIDSPMLPSPDGHRDAVIEFLGECTPKPSARNKHIRQERKRALIAPHHDGDKTHWKIYDGEDSIDVILLLNRIWWAITPQEEMECSSWSDTILTLNRVEFRATMTHELQILLPKIHGQRVKVGFPSAMAMREFPSKKGVVRVPLRNFAGDDEIKQLETEARILLRISGPTGDQEIPIVVIPSNQPPPARTPALPAPPPLVKGHLGQWRDGKGYSPRELKDSEVSKKRGLRVDRRRRSRHHKNIQALEAWKEGRE